ncbi:TlpA disulfide reductase family protein [Novosphingobium sp. FKTRR1]|uniref:TlpA family protein disulfide reductase n=1 Tax=Novosphingobium sp. FKTRR1 TaxID=2879118 RepID=UPI001CF025A4
MRRVTGLLAAMLALSGAAPPQLPAFAGTTVDGAALRVDPAAHRVVVIHYWATWCVPCRVEMPLLDRIGHAHGVQIVGVALDSGASRQKIRAAVTNVGFALIRAGDTGIPARAIPSALPETLVYGRDGRLRARFGAGGRMLDEAALDQLLPTLLAEK